MAIRIESSISKRLPIPGIDYSSHQASITISSEISDFSHINQEAARLFAACEKVVDRQLAQMQAPSAATTASISAPPSSPSPSSQPTTASTPVSSASYPSANRRGPAPVSAAQLRFLRQLCDRTPGALELILSEHRVATIEALTSRAASGVIDRLKTVAP
jgi:hypothetical protein